jgi:hypothetical protein
LTASGFVAARTSRTTTPRRGAGSHRPLGAVRRRLAARGKFEEGIPILKRAIARTVNPPGWYFSLIAIDLYLKRDYKRMLQFAERSAGEGRGVSQALIAIAAGKLGKRDAARQALKKMAEYKSFAGDRAALRRHGATDEIVNALMAGLSSRMRRCSTNRAAFSAELPQKHEIDGEQRIGRIVG